MIFFSPLNILLLFYLLMIQIFIRHKELPTPINVVNQELLLVSSWFRANKLTVHPDKSKFILFHPQGKMVDLSRFNTFLAIISRVHEDKFLGITIHENLSWKPHITAICGKVSKVIGILSKSRHVLPSHTLKAIYNNSLFFPYITYGTFIWGSTCSSYLEPL